VVAALQSFHLTTAGWLIVAACALLIGINKTGLNGVAMLTVPLMAAVFGGRDSTGVILLMFLVGDVYAVTYYHQHAQWRYLVKLLPWSLAGIVLGVLVGKHISELQFRQLLAVVIIAGVVLMVVQEIRGKPIQVPETWWMGALLGIASGFTSMVGNVAFAIMSLYLLSMKLPKNSFIGTAAWFFFIVNVMKLPFHIFVWHTISAGPLALDLIMTPVIIAGALLGVTMVRRIPEKPYRIIIICATAAAAVKLIF